jgi:hypothetical protein
MCQNKLVKVELSLSGEVRYSGNYDCLTVALVICNEWESKSRKHTATCTDLLEQRAREYKEKIVAVPNSPFKLHPQ